MQIKPVLNELTCYLACASPGSPNVLTIIDHRSPLNSQKTREFGGEGEAVVKKE